MVLRWSHAVSARLDGTSVPASTAETQIEEPGGALTYELQRSGIYYWKVRLDHPQPAEVIPPIRLVSKIRTQPPRLFPQSGMLVTDSPSPQHSAQDASSGISHVEFVVFADWQASD
jgi:hypothetical protein